MRTLPPAGVFGVVVIIVGSVIGIALPCSAAESPHPLQTWVKQHPRQGAAKPPPRMGYETSLAYDPLQKRIIRYGGHNQGGGGEQNSEVWTYDLANDVWELKEPNDAPPGVCCAQQNVFDDSLGLFIRFPAFSGSHGWQSFREIYLKDCSVWTYDLPNNRFKAMRPLPAIKVGPLHGAAYDPHHQVTVVHAGEGATHPTAAYDLYENRWHVLAPKPAPESGISQPGFTYDATNRVFVLFGSQFRDDERTWLYDLRKNAWRVLEVKDHPPGKNSSPVLAADTRNGIVLCSVIGQAGLETWALDVAKATWTRLKLPAEPDKSGSRNRVLIFIPDENLFVLENRTDKEQQVYTFRYADAPAPARGPSEVRVLATQSGAQLTWKAPPGPGPWRYTVHRAPADKPLWQVDLAPIGPALDVTTFDDANLDPGAAHYYQVRAVDSAGKQTTPSLIVRTMPAVIDDLVVSCQSEKRVTVNWKPSTAQDIAGYLVYRAEVSVFSSDQATRIKGRYPATEQPSVGRIARVGKFEPITPKPIPAAQFIDETIDLSTGQQQPKDVLAEYPLHKDQFNAAGTPYRYATCAYRVCAVNRRGIAGGFSTVVYSIPSAVQHVFAREEGAAAARIKWAPNPEKSIKGYRVYRHDGRYEKNPIVCLTPQPIAATEFLDEQSGKATRRYEVVAVDALDQEGEPSQPVWTRREWARYYTPYTKDWHQ